MYATVIEFNPLPDSIGAAPENYNFFIVGWVGLAFLLVSGVQVGRMRFEFRPTGIDPFKYRKNIIFNPIIPDIRFLTIEKACQTFVGKTILLGFFNGFPG